MYSSSDKNLKYLNFEAFLQRQSWVPVSWVGTELVAPPRNSCVKLSTIQVPTGEDRDVEGFAAGSAVGTQAKHRNEA